MTLWLLDTHVLIWALAEPQRLDPVTGALVRDPDLSVRFSAASIWEIAIKAERGRLDFLLGADHIAREAPRVDFEELPVLASAAARVQLMARHHRDPFDRLLVAQAIDSGGRLSTADRILCGYSELVTLIRPLLPAE